MKEAKAIDPKELRIGNIFLTEENVPVRLKYLQFDEDANSFILVYGNEVKGEYVWIEDAKPVPLTEEWLEGLGFEKMKKLPYHLDPNLPTLFFYKNDFELFKFGCHYKFFTDLEADLYIKTVHQLQNLYFALTGEELTVK